MCKGERERDSVTDVELGDGGRVVVDDDGPGGDDDGDRPHAVDGRQEPLNERHLSGAADAQDIQVRLLPLAGRLPAAAAASTAGPGISEGQGQGPKASGNAKRRAPAEPAKILATGCSSILGVALSSEFSGFPP
jgi:hypothetical protein